MKANFKLKKSKIEGIALFRNKREKNVEGPFQIVFDYKEFKGSLKFRMEIKLCLLENWSSWFSTLLGGKQNGFS